MRFPALSSRDFRIYLGGNFFALNGNWILRLIIGWLGWEATGSITWTGVLAFLLYAPTIVSGPLFGVLADRIDIRRAGLVIQIVLAILSLCMFALHTSGLLEIWGLAGLALVFGIVSSAHHPVRMSMVPRIVPRDAIPNAVSLTSINFNLGRFLGPAIGGWLINWFGASTAILVNFACYLPLITAFYLVRPRERETGNTASSSFFGQLLDGAAYAWRHPVIFKALALVALFAMILRGSLELLPALADGVFGRGADGLGQAVAASGAGALLSASLSAFVTMRDHRPIPLVAILATLVGLALTSALGLATVWLVTLLILAAMGFCGALVGISLMQTLQMLVDDGYRGRVMSLWSVVGIGGAAIGAAVLGVVADLFGLPSVLIGSGVGGVGAALVLLALKPDRETDAAPKH